MKDGYLENVEEFMSYILHVSSSTKKSIMGCSLLPGQNSSFSNQEMILRSTLHKTTLICSTLTKEIGGFRESDGREKLANVTMMFSPLGGN